jgi:transposase
MRGPSVVPQWKGLHLEAIRAADDQVEVELSAVGPRAACPRCRHPSSAVHSRYHRTMADLPWSGARVTLIVLARRFRCRIAACSRRVFCERLPQLVAAYARHTQVLADTLLAIGLALGGRPGARLATKLRVPTSRMTLLRRVRALPDPPAATPSVLGVDDWAFRRGRRYGTILVDLERHRPVDLLPETTATSLATWLQAHPGIVVISRDRGGSYADGARQGAPTAIQVADRFHLLKNLGDVVERVLRRHPDLLARIPTPGASTVPTSVLRPDRGASRERVQHELQQRYEAIRQARAQGLSIAATARATGLHRHTLEKYDRLASAPTRRHTWRRPSALAPYEAYLQERWRHGARKARGLWREIAKRGYPGAYQNVARYVAALRKQAGEGTAARSTTTGLTARRAVGLVLSRADQQTHEAGRAVQQLKAAHPDVCRAVGLLERFARLLRGPSEPTAPQALAQWLADARATGLSELDAFVTKLEQDRRAVEAALLLPYSQGQTEGQINRLKTLKRMMYGRANFDLLRKRFLAAS